MPIKDGCLIEETAVKDAWLEAEEVCLLALEALIEWQEARLEAYDACSYLGSLGGGLSELIDEFGWREQIEKDIENCIGDIPEVIDAWNLYLDLEIECDIAREKALAIQDEYEACIHELHDGVPFA